MRRTLLTPALLLILGLTSACAHQSVDSSSPLAAEPRAALDPSDTTDASDASDETDEFEAPSEGAVISFDDLDAGGPTDTIAAPPKRKQIPGFELFGTGETASEEGPRLTLPPDME